MAIGAYDGMALLAHMIKATKGKLGDTEAALASLKDWKYNSPRGPISIDPATRDIVMNEYLVEVVKGKDGKLHQKQLGKIDNVKDPAKSRRSAPARRRADAFCISFGKTAAPPGGGLFLTRAARRVASPRLQGEVDERSEPGEGRALSRVSNPPHPDPLPASGGEERAAGGRYVGATSKKKCSTISRVKPG